MLTSLIRVQLRPFAGRYGKPLRCYEVIEVDCVVAFHHVFGGSVVVLADVFKNFGVGAPAKIKPSAPRPGVDAGVIDQNLIFDRVEVRSGKAFDSS